MEACAQGGAASACAAFESWQAGATLFKLRLPPALDAAGKRARAHTMGTHQFILSCARHHHDFRGRAQIVSEAYTMVKVSSAQVMV